MKFDDLAPVLTLSSYGRRPRPADHFVEFYEHDADLTETLVRFVSSGLEADEAAILVLTESHRALIEKAMGSDAASYAEKDRLIWVDVNEALQVFMRGDLVDQDAFKSHFESLVRAASAGGRKVRIFGEMVAVLWERRNTAAALQLEELWNELAKTVEFRLFCAYPAEVFSETNLGPLRSVCSHHTHVLAAS